MNWRWYSKLLISLGACLILLLLFISSVEGTAGGSPPVVVTSDVTYGNNYFYNPLSNSGVSSSEVPISSGPSDHEPDVALDINGNGYAVWASNTEEIKFAFLPSGGSWGATEVVAPLQGVIYTYPKIAVDSGGNVYVVWMDIPPGDDPSCHYNVCNWDILFARRSSNGSWTLPTRVNNDIGATRQMYPNIVVDSNGNAQAIWKDEREGQCNVFSSYRPNGGSWSGNVKVNDSGSCLMGTVGDGLGLAMAPNGYVWASWSVNVYNGIRVSQRTGPGNWNPSESVNPTGDFPTLAIDGQGNIYAAWNAFGGSGREVQVAFKPQGGPWSSKYIIAPGLYPAISAAQSSIGYLAWITTSPYSVFGTSLLFGRDNFQVTRLDGDTSGSWKSDVSSAMNGAGKLSVVWSDGRGGVSRIYGIMEEVVPFLDLPFQYTNFSEAASGYYGDKNPGQVMSWFDHNSLGQTVTIWSGRTSSGNEETYYKTCADYDRAGCYDGHNGIDFRNTQEVNEIIYGAASGTVFGVVNNCQTSPGGCTGYGNRVWIDHHNGYATLYGHLKSVLVTNGTEITNRLAQPLGVMGCTGRCTGKHLHFGLYYDQNSDDHWSETEAVDSYGYQEANYLWIHSLSNQQLIGISGGSLSDPSGNITVTVPASAVIDPVTLELWDTPPIADASSSLRSTGNSFWMRVLEWLTGESGTSLFTNVSTNSFDIPVTVTVHYDPSWMMHLDTFQMTISQWDEVSQAWVALSTTIDTVNQLATAQTTQPGHFDLQAPLVCPADTHEPNDSYDGASFIKTDGTLVSNLFDIATDEDWFKFDAWAGAEYNIQTANLAAGVDTVMELYDHDGVTLLVTDENNGDGNASSLTWQSPAGGTYFVHVRQAAGSVYGCNASYDLSILASYNIYQPLVNR